MEQPSCLRKILTQKMGKTSHTAVMPACSSLRLKDYNLFYSALLWSKAKKTPWSSWYTGVLSPANGHNLELSLVQPFPCSHTLVGWRRSLLWFWIPLWNSMRALIILSNSLLPQFLGGEVPLPALAEVLFWIRPFS